MPKLGTFLEGPSQLHSLTIGPGVNGSRCVRQAWLKSIDLIQWMIQCKRVKRRPASAFDAAKVKVKVKIEIVNECWEEGFVGTGAGKYHWNHRQTLGGT